MGRWICDVMCHWMEKLMLGDANRSWKNGASTPHSIRFYRLRGRWSGVNNYNTRGMEVGINCLDRMHAFFIITSFFLFPFFLFLS